MKNEYVYVTGQDGEIYEISPTEALLCFLQRMAEGEAAERQPSTEQYYLLPEESQLSCAIRSA